MSGALAQDDDLYQKYLLKIQHKIYCFRGKVGKSQ